MSRPIRLLKTQLFLMICCMTATLEAQVMTTDTLMIRHIEQEQGLSQLNALSLDFDSDGYLWIGTENGLNRFNAYEMKTFMAEDGERSLPDDHIRDLYFENDTLWLATNTASLIAHPTQSDHFVKLIEQPGMAVKYTQVIHPVSPKILLLGAYGNCIIYDKSKQKFTAFALPSPANIDFVTSIEKSDQKNFLIGTNQNGIFNFNLTEGKFSQLPELSFLNRIKINDLYKISPDEIIVASEKSMWIYRHADRSLNHLFPNLADFPEITKIEKWDENHLYFSSANHGYLWNKEKELRKVVFKNLNGKIIQEKISQIKSDAAGGKWIGTKGRGVLYYHPKLKRFTPYRIKTSSTPRKEFISIFNFLRDEDNLWMATEFGFARYDLDTEKYTFYPEDYLEYTLAKDANGTIWGGGFGQGLVQYDEKEDRFKSIPTGIEDMDVIQITPIDENKMWIHTWSDGIFELDLNTLKTQKKFFGKYQMIRSRTSFTDKSGNIWIGNDEGIFKFSHDHLTKIDGLSNNRVFSIAEDPLGNIWVGTAKGLNKIDPITEHITSYTKNSGLPNDFIYGVEVDSEGLVWSSTNFGLSRFDPKNKHFTNFTETDGLQNNEFNGKASYQDEFGILYFGGMNGFNKFHPSETLTNLSPGKTLIENIAIFGNPIEENIRSLDRLELTSNQRVIRFSYSALNYLWPERNQYQFKLEGFDEDWRSDRSSRNITYTNLDSGEYIFRVKGSNNEGIWGEEDQLKILIKAPWYKTFWFKFSLIFLLLIAVAGLFIIRNYRQKITNRRLRELVDLRTDELQKSNQELNESLAISEKQQENIQFLMQELQHRVKNNLQIIISLIDMQELTLTDSDAKNKLKRIQDQIFTVSRTHDILYQKQAGQFTRLDIFIQKLATEILSFSGVQVQLKTKLTATEYPVHKISYLGLILNELIINSIKHAFSKQKEPEIYLELAPQDAEKIVFSYRDNGSGIYNRTFHQESMGLKLIDLLVDVLQGESETYNENGFVFKLIINKEKTSR